MSRHTLGLRGTIPGAAPRQPYTPPDRPLFFTSPDRACDPRHGDSNLFVSEDKKERSEAVRLCNRTCPFTAECLAWAVQEGEVHYVWGGVDFSKTADRRKVTGEPEPEVETADRTELIDKSLASIRFFAGLTPDKQATVVRGARNRGMTYADIAKRVRRTISALQVIAGEPGPTIDDRVRHLYDSDHSDAQIALSLGIHPGMVAESRHRQGLPAKFGPGGRRINHVTSSRTTRSLVTTGGGVR